MKIMLSGFFADKSTYRKFFIVISIVLFSTLIFLMAGALLVDAVYGVSVITDPAALNNLEDPVVLAAMKMMQLVSTGIGMFLVPSLLLAFLFSHKPATYLALDKKPNTDTVLLSILIMFAVVPLINLMVVWNQEMNLPPFFSGLEDWMKSSEDNAARITEALLNMNSSGEMLYNLLIIAVMPAIGEELLFRGILQKLFRDLTNNIHAAIIITAVVFSAIHMQFYGFIPRMMLGVLFGYLFYWTGNLWIPIIAHFINNGAAVLFAYYAGKQELPFNQDTIGTMEGEWKWVLISAIIVTGALYQIRKNGKPEMIG